MKAVLTKLLTNFSFRLYLLYFLTVGGAAWFIATRSLQALEISVNQTAEDILIDTANLLAEMASQDVENGEINTQRFEVLMPVYLNRHFDAAIYQRVKKRPDLHVYITDQSGVVRYDSGGQSLGEDFSRWRDVAKTLQGLYGARASPLDPLDTPDPRDSRDSRDPSGSPGSPGVETTKTTITTTNNNEQAKGLFIAAPIKDYSNAGRIVGVLTVVKGKTPLGGYITLSTEKITAYALLVFLVAVAAGTFITWWLWRSINKLSRYANQLGRGQYVPQPKIIHSDFKPLANSVESMYKALEGKEYVENYTHTMAHELKSPLTGIIATTELLQQPLPTADRQQFIANIHDSAQRMTVLIERLLALAAVENQSRIEHPQTVSLTDLVRQVLASRSVQIQQKQLHIEINVDIDTDIDIAVDDDSHADAAITVRGEPTLLSQSVANLLDNAIDFSPQQSRIDMGIKRLLDNGECRAQMTLRDRGAGIADFAQSRLFERFFSTPRPDTQQRSSGLGLAFVKEAIQLHGGTVTLTNHPDGGTMATLTLPI